MLNSHKIKTRIFELQLTQEEIANKMGLNITTLHLKINNKRRIYADEVAKLCEILQITTSRELRDYFGLDFLIIDSCVDETESKLGGA